MRRRLLTAAGLVVIVAAIGGYFTLALRPDNIPISTRLAKAMGVETSTPFKLVDDEGKPITEKALEGHPSLIFFGFTHCPEVCPTTLFEMAGWLKTLGEEGEPLRAFYFTVDPERDTPEVMHSYVTAFSDRITGITGRPEDMAKVIKGWHVYAKKVPTDDGSYTMDHTASVFLVDAAGRLRGTIAYQEPEEVALQKIRNLLEG